MTYKLKRRLHVILKISQAKLETGLKKVLEKALGWPDESLGYTCPGNKELEHITFYQK